MNKKKVVKESKKVLNEKVREKANFKTLKKQVKRDYFNCSSCNDYCAFDTSRSSNKSYNW